MVAPEIKRFLTEHDYTLTEFKIFIGYDEDHLNRYVNPTDIAFGLIEINERRM
ncbi:MAG: hypothetical protein ACLUAR_01890 [Pilosibacter sp.]